MEMMELNRGELEEVTGGSIRIPSPNQTANRPICRSCRCAVQNARTHYVCTNVSCAEFSVKKTKDEVDWL